MKIKLVNTFIVLLLFSSFSFTQNDNPFAKEIDSVQQLIKANQKENEEHIRLLNELARLYFYSGQVKEAFFTTRKARTLAEEIGFEGGNVMYYLTLSVFQLNNEDLRVYYQKKAEWLSKSFANQSRNYYILPIIPEYNEGSDFHKLRENYLKLLPHFQEEADKEIRANILFKLGYIAFMLENLEESMDYLDTIRSLYKELGQVYPVFLCLKYKMGNLISLDRLEAAKEIELELVNLFLSSKDENAMGLIASTMASGYAEDGRYLLSIEYYLKSIEEFERVNDLDMLSRSYYDLGVAYENLSISSKAVESYEKCIHTLKTLGRESNLYHVYGTMIFPLIAMEEFDKADEYLKLAEQDTVAAGHDFRQARLWDAQGQILMSQGKYDLAIPYFRKALNTFTSISESFWAIPFMYVNIAECNLKIGKPDEALSNALLCLERTSDGQVRVARKVNLLISNIYETLGNESLALKYLKTYQEIAEKSDKNDELSRIADAEIKSILDKSQKEIVALEREQELANQENKIQRLWLFSAAGALLSALLVLYILFRNNRNKQKINTQLSKQKEKVEQTLEKLKETQAQLIQSEKMASLGELTAGIAHEIQNPLNFVNNFSEVNQELIADLIEELDKGALEEVRSISRDLLYNEEKIIHHGKRADAIVKGMLQHSRSGNGHKESTDLNLLADEYLRLAYHGLRAKDNTFNAAYKTELDPALPKVNAVPQDVGRVLLNLINNAFQASAERTRQNEQDYHPEVKVTTTQDPQHVVLSVKDNGPGIPQDIKNKIFQPFFTTKTTGEGTGLGLSISYDIITNGHGGMLEVKSQQGQGTEMIIRLNK